MRSKNPSRPQGGAHAIVSDIDYIGAFLFEATVEDNRHSSVDPEAMAGNENVFDGLADAPPPISGYREANVAGMACWNCGHFTAVGDVDGDGDVDGICNLFEARAEGECTCDRFTAHADLFRQSPHTSWQEDMQQMRDRGGEMDGMGPSVSSVDYADNAVLNEIIFGSDATEEDGLVWKDILRTGRWTHTPTTKGVIKKALQIVRDGQSDPGNGVISLSEIYENFQDRAVPYVTVPLSDDKEDHKNIARLNTGFVRKLKLVDRDGMTFLQAGIDFTEPDVKGKVLRGTIPDVSAGIPFGVTRRSDNRMFNAVLDHVCLTRRPFVDNLTPFGIAAADGDEIPVEAWEAEAEAPESEASPAPPGTSQPSPRRESSPQDSENALSYRQHERAISDALRDQLRLSPEYRVDDVRGTTAIVYHHSSKAKWEVPFRMTGHSDKPIILASVENWKLIEEASSEEAMAASNGRTELQRAQDLRELRLAQPTSKTGGIQMSALSLDGVELSDEARAQIQTILSENDDLRRTNRENEINSRISELEELGLKDRPGALKLYRQVMLSDDGGPAIVLLADSGDEKERLTALEILDRFIDGLKAEGDVVFSDQHFASGNDNKPPKDASGERKPLEERVEQSKTALYGDRSKRRTGRK